MLINCLTTFVQAKWGSCGELGHEGDQPHAEQEGPHRGKDPPHALRGDGQAAEALPQTLLQVMIDGKVMCAADLHSHLCKEGGRGGCHRQYISAATSAAIILNPFRIIFFPLINRDCPSLTILFQSPPVGLRGRGQQDQLQDAHASAEDDEREAAEEEEREDWGWRADDQGDRGGGGQGGRARQDLDGRQRVRLDGRGGDAAATSVHEHDGRKDKDIVLLPSDWWDFID